MAARNLAGMDGIPIRKKRREAMKRLIGAALALSLLGATAASAAPASFAPVDYRYHSYRHHDDGNGAAVAAGVVGFLALTAILASQQHHDRDDWYDRDRDYGDRDYDRGYDRGYGYGYAAPGNGYAAPYGGYGYAAPYRGW